MPPRPRAIQVAILAAAVVVAIAGRADVALVVLPPDHQFTLAESVMADQLLATLAQQAKGAAFTVTSKSATADKLAGLTDASGAVQAKPLSDLAVALGVKNIVGLVWSDQTITAVTLKAGGGLAEKAAPEPKSPEDGRKVAALLATVMSESAPAAPVTPALPQPAAPATPKPAAPETPKPATTAAPATPATPAPPAAPAVTPKPETPTPGETKSTPAGQMQYELAARSFREGNYQMALDRLDDALAQGASDEDVLALRAKIYAATGDTAKHVRALQDLVNTNPARTDAVVELALELVDQGLWQDAIRTLEKGIRAMPKEPQLYVREAQIQQKQGRVMEALETLRRGMDATNDPKVALALGAAYEAAGDWRSARTMYSKLVASDDPKMRARALDALGDLYARQGQAEPAVEAYVEAARFRGEPAMLTVERYRSVYGAVDKLVESDVTRAWAQFQAMGSPGSLPREKVLAGLQAADAQLARALSLCDEVLPPADLHEEHRQRELYYAMLRTAITAALTYVDTGRQDMLDLARERWQQARSEAPKLSGAQGQ